MWQNNKWLIQISEDNDIFYIWTFAGDKINRCVSIFLGAHVDAEVSYDYKSVSVKFMEISHSKEDLVSILERMKTESNTVVSDTLEAQIGVKWISKFSECLPDNLAKKAILEKVIDLQGAIVELNRVAIELVN